MEKDKILERKKIYLVALFLLLFFLNAFAAIAKEYPSRPIKVVVPYPPGGVMDLISRSMTDTMSKVLGQPVFVENKPGGGTTVGYTFVASSKPDGYTIGHCSVGPLIGSYLVYDVSYHPLKSFTFLGGVGVYANSIIVKLDSPWKSWNEFIDYSRKYPNEVKMGFTTAVGTNAISTKWIEKKLGLKWKQITFDGEPQCITALLGGHIDAFPGGGAHNILVKDGRARMLLALTKDPIPDYPEVPTFKQVFGKEFVNYAAFLAPAGIPGPILKKLETATYEGTKAPEFLAVMKKMNMPPQWRSSQDFAQDVEKQFLTYQEFLKDLNLLKKKD